jgi:excisionase family DNA binding protein
VEKQASKERMVFNVDETGEVLNLSPGTVRKGIREGWIPAVRFGRKWMIPRCALEGMLAAAGKAIVQGGGRSDEA